MYHGAGGSDMSLFSVVEHNDDRYTGSAQENAYAEASDLVDDVDLSFCIYSSSYCVCNYDSTGGKTWK